MMDWNYFEGIVEVAKDMKNAYAEQLFSDAEEASYLNFYIHDETTNDQIILYSNLHYIREEANQKDLHFDLNCSSTDSDVERLLNSSEILQDRFIAFIQ